LNLEEEKASAAALAMNARTRERAKPADARTCETVKPRTFETRGRPNLRNRETANIRNPRTPEPAEPRTRCWPLACDF